MGSMKISNVRYHHGGCLEPPSSLPWPNILIVGKMIYLESEEADLPFDDTHSKSTSPAKSPATKTASKSCSC